MHAHIRYRTSLILSSPMQNKREQKKRCKRKSHRGTLGRQGGALHISLGLTGTQRERERELSKLREGGHWKLATQHIFRSTIFAKYPPYVNSQMQMAYVRSRAEFFTSLILRSRAINAARDDDYHKERERNRCCFQKQSRLLHSRPVCVGSMIRFFIL